MASYVESLLYHFIFFGVVPALLPARAMFGWAQHAGGWPPRLAMGRRGVSLAG
jgi:hypothetical protein